MQPARDLYIDRLRTILTALVIVHHTAITFGGSGGWFWTERTPDGSASSIVLTLFLATNQAYFMGFFFLLAGYFTPGSLERKGYGRFLLDRFLRLGLPLLFFIVVLGPLTVGLGNIGDGGTFWGGVHWVWQHRRILNGPLWFAQALLIFSLAYCAWRAFQRRPLVEARMIPRPVPRFGWWLVTALAVGAAALAIRQVVPTGENVFGLQLGFFASYVFLFALGIAARRHDWVRQLTWRDVRPWIVTLVLVWPTLPAGFLLAQQHPGVAGKPNFSGGLSWPAILYAFWEPLVAWGLMGAWLLVGRRSLNAPSRGWDWLGRRAYAAYVLHPPVLVGIAVLLHGWAAAALVKFVVVGVLACAGTWLAAALFVRLPGVRQIV